ncbi:Sua5/YciO/YrdC/YwlC family protein [Nocardia sp. NBC_01499]|uniref:carbamoyltransferase HypF n=1 Tax=Nocardia sp. NBC_01499 TaxID=2903597 RepID=UPI003868ED52
MTAHRSRRRVVVRGVVQGVGFRPFVYTTAAELALSGSVSNDSSGVIVEIEGAPADLDEFVRRVLDNPPPLAVVESVEQQTIALCGGTGFHIADTTRDGGGRTLASPDVALCADCASELADPANRRHRHPFINCTNCGPRFTIIASLPYDRDRTSMADFPMCARCAREYADPTDRRFHAQPIACPDCGPTLAYTGPGVGDPLIAARKLLRDGGILAVKGIGGYHLACDATNEAAVAELRKRKQRGDKPFAVMVANVDSARAIVEVDATAAALLTSPARPIVLLARRVAGAAGGPQADLPGPSGPGSARAASPAPPAESAWSPEQAESVVPVGIIEVDQQGRVQSGTRIGVESGASPVTDGPETMVGLERGHHGPPTVRADMAQAAQTDDVSLIERAWPSGRVFPADSVAPRNPDLGVMIAYAPLHLLLFGLPDDPPGPQVLVMTSGNLGGEPICYDDNDARTRLAGLADGWLSHNRRILVPCDDSVVRLVDGMELPVRRSRGYAPLPLALPIPMPPTLAVGADLKNTCAVADGRYAWLSQHIGDMDDLATLRAFDDAEHHLEQLTGVQPTQIVADAHPRYRSTAWAQRNAGDRPVRLVQHHHAHIASVMGEHGLGAAATVLGIAFDGTGFGPDGAVWGGEVLAAGYKGFRRLAHLKYAPLAGGDVSVHRPYRMALAHLWAAGIDWSESIPSVHACPADERAVLTHQFETGLGCVPTSSMGRLFDAVSSLAGVRHVVDYEAQAAIELEGLARGVTDYGVGYRFAVEAELADAVPALRDSVGYRVAPDAELADAAPALRDSAGCRVAPDAELPDAAPALRDSAGYRVAPDAAPGDAVPALRDSAGYRFALDTESTDAAPAVIDPASVLAAVVADVAHGVSPAVIGARFHDAVAHLILELAVAYSTPSTPVALSGGVFQNALLLSRSRALLQDNGFHVISHRRLPPNDGGLAFGQLLAVSAG